MKDEEVGKMVCHLVIDLNKELCTKSGAWTKFVQGKKLSSTLGVVLFIRKY